ncbi:serine protease snake-like, partial [Condylostylus longicornis]|uniref:serine protease snake-like n=1 Tax=Condylostylus longicornis TaxID=2530218 RepID=UPI00244E2F25
NTNLSITECHEYQDYVYEKSHSISLIGGGGQKHEEKIERCGLRTIELVLGGKDAKPLEFPHIALLGYKKPDEVSWNCGGSLISENFILTAAHCDKTEYGSPSLVRLGELNIKSDTDDTKPRDFNIQKILVHPNYDNKIGMHDIALIQLAKNVEFDRYIRPACLATSSDWTKSYVWAIGWGLNNTYDTTGTDHLQKVKLDKFTEDVCQSKYPKQSITYTRQICVGSHTEEKDTCQGDSGGPLQVLHEKEDCMWEIVGITSFGHVCGSIGVPGVYTRVYHYVDWIEENVWK